MSRLVALLALAIALIPSRAFAWSCIDAACTHWCDAPAYSIGRLSASLEAIAPGSTVSELRRGMEDWGLVSCSGLEPVYLGVSSMVAVEGDGLSTVDVFESGWPYDANVIGMSTRVVSGNCVVESDIFLNGQNYSLVTRPGYQSEINAYSATLHEAGHFYGLGHAATYGAVMYYRYGAGKLSIAADDEQGICYLYPGADPAPDCAITGCPSGRVCESGQCVTAPLGPCDTDLDCPAFQRCDLATGACKTPSGGTSDLGTPCEADADCLQNLCLATPDGSVCSKTCDAGNPSSCETGFYCSGAAISDCAIGVCLPGARGAGAYGAACTSATDCSSLYCSPEGICSSPCEPGVATSCPGNGAFVCHPGPLAACGSCGAPLELGASCNRSDECASGACFDADLDGRGVCASRCSSGSSCPAGFACQTAGDESLCLAKPESGSCGCTIAGAPAPRQTLPFGLVALFCVTLVVRRATKRRCRVIPSENRGPSAITSGLTTGPSRMAPDSSS